MKPTVYIETLVISYLTARQSNDVRALASQSVTLEWWEAQRPNFELFISPAVCERHNPQETLALTLN
jgi:hypothetical protein